MKKITDHLSVLLADTYALYLKTQNYHWHVHGPYFKTLHELFEEQYNELALAVDALAERIRTLDAKAPATFSEFIKLTTIKEGNSSLKSEQMIKELMEDHELLIKKLKQSYEIAEKALDHATSDLINSRIDHHEKTHWMLASSL